MDSGQGSLRRFYSDPCRSLPWAIVLGARAYLDSCVTGLFHQKILILPFASPRNPRASRGQRRRDYLLGQPDPRAFLAVAALMLSVTLLGEGPTRVRHQPLADAA